MIRTSRPCRVSAAAFIWPRKTHPVAIVPEHQPTQQRPGGEDLQGERQIAPIAQDGHLEQLRPADKWHVVDPFRHRKDVPHLPEPAADQPGGEEDQDGIPAALSHLGGDAGIPQQRVDGIEQPGRARSRRRGTGYRGNASDRRKVARPISARNDEPDSTRIDAEPAATRRKWRKRAQKLRGHEDGRHDGRERQRGQQRILDRVVWPGHEVPPVVEVAVGNLEQPPEGDREDEQRCEPAPIASEERCTRAAHGETVDGEDVPQPEREKRVLRVRRRPEPGYPPGDDHQRQAGPESQRSVRDRGGGPPRGNMMKHIHRSIPPAPRSSVAPLV